MLQYISGDCLGCVLRGWGFLCAGICGIRDCTCQQAKDFFQFSWGPYVAPNLQVVLDVGPEGDPVRGGEVIRSLIVRLVMSEGS